MNAKNGIKIYLYMISAVTTLLLGLTVIFFVYEKVNTTTLDIVQINDVKYKISQNEFGKTYDFDYAVIDEAGNLLYKTSENITSDLNIAIIHRDTIINLNNGGKLIIYNDFDNLIGDFKTSLRTASVILLCIQSCLFIALLFHINTAFFRPFHKMRTFAKNVAAGDLEYKLTMDKKNAFGAFTESFDLMREELSRAREAEQSTNKSKKELVASLSHDIKTPVASIKAVAELLSAKAENDTEKYQLSVIIAKTDQINTLITNMFSATLEELQELKVNPSECNSGILYDIIRSTDHYERVLDFEIPECLILADNLRLGQIVDNIINNSYKYADTEIYVSAYFSDDFLSVDFTDSGSGVSDEELLLLFNKFYRAGNSAGKSGSGLGLYISRYLANKMSGDVIAENIEDEFGIVTGFKITLNLKIA